MNTYKNVEQLHKFYSANPVRGVGIDDTNLSRDIL